MHKGSCRLEKSYGLQERTGRRYRAIFDVADLVQLLDVVSRVDAAQRAALCAHDLSSHCSCVRSILVLARRMELAAFAGLCSYV